MIKLLDCTLRDGGYYTNWDFNEKLVKNYLKYIENLPIEYIEIGYRSNVNNGYCGEYFYLPKATLEFIKQNSNKKIAIMLNLKEFYNSNNLSLLDRLENSVDLVRIATDPYKIDIAIKLSKEIKKRGFRVAINIMYISKLDHKHSFFDSIEELSIYTDILNLVDSYGTIYPEQLRLLIHKIQDRTNIDLGFHGHNNLELAFSNTFVALENGVKYIDSTILGMGRGAGNLKTELILTYLKSMQKLDVDLNSLSKLNELFTPLLQKYKWGTNLAYMISGAYSLAQKDVMEYLEIDRYSMGTIIKKIQNNVENISQYNLNLKSKNVLIIGGADSVKEHINAIKSFVMNHNITIIHATSKHLKIFDNIDSLQLFAVAGDESSKIENIPSSIKYAITSSKPMVDSLEVNTFRLDDISFTKYIDSPLSISLEISNLLKATNIYLVGFDGYSSLKSKKELYLMNENQEIVNSFDKNLIFLTQTNYKNIIQKSIYGLIQ